MNVIRRFIAPVVILAAAMTLPGAASALTVTTTVLGTANPWDMSVNPNLSYQNGTYGHGSGTGPTVVTGGLPFSAGSEFTIVASGIVNIGGPNPDNGPAGISGATEPPPSGFPSDYTMGPYNAGELLGAFANASGMVVGSPFVVGTGGSFAAPAGASELLFGINDDDFGNNTGSFDLSVSTGVSAVPLPSSAPMFGAALMALGAVGYGLKRKKAAALA